LLGNLSISILNFKLLATRAAKTYELLLCGYCLAMVCGDFLAGASLEDGNQSGLLQSMSRLLKFLPGEQRQELLSEAGKKA
jgi:hypothetical protein